MGVAQSVLQAGFESVDLRLVLFSKDVRTTGAPHGESSASIMNLVGYVTVRGLEQEKTKETERMGCR